MSYAVLDWLSVGEYRCYSMDSIFISLSWHNHYFGTVSLMTHINSSPVALVIDSGVEECFIDDVIVTSA